MKLGDADASMAYDLGAKVNKDAFDGLARMVQMTPRHLQPAMVATFAALTMLKLNTLRLIDPQLSKIIDQMVGDTQGMIDADLAKRLAEASAG